MFNRVSPALATTLSNGQARPVSAILPSSTASTAGSGPGHARNQSFSPSTVVQQTSGSASSGRKRSNSYRNTTPASGTFAPTFIKSEHDQKTSSQIDGIEGENDFSGKRYVWVKDGSSAFLKGWVVENLDDGRLMVQCEDGSV